METYALSTFQNERLSYYHKRKEPETKTRWLSGYQEASSFVHWRHRALPDISQEMDQDHLRIQGRIFENSCHFFIDKEAFEHKTYVAIFEVIENIDKFCILYQKVIQCLVFRRCGKNCGFFEE